MALAQLDASPSKLDARNPEFYQMYPNGGKLFDGESKQIPLAVAANLETGEVEVYVESLPGVIAVDKNDDPITKMILAPLPLTWHKAVV